MHLDPLAAQRFIAGYKTLLLHVHAMSMLKKGNIMIADLATARAYLTERLQNLDAAFAAFDAEGGGIADDIATAIRSMRVDQWVYLRHTTRYAVCIDHEMTVARAVSALTDPIATITGKPPVTFKADVFEFDGYYVCDGIIETRFILARVIEPRITLAMHNFVKRGNFMSRPFADMARAKRIREDKIRERRIDFEIAVDAYNETERAVGWYCYLQDCLQMPFAAIWRSAQSTSTPEGLEVEVIEMAAEDDCMAEIHVLIKQGDLQLVVPLGQLECQSPNEETCEAVADWHYWQTRCYEY